MWPQTLQMSRDECRGMLRRLELESYSHIISVFRAQGSLSETKAKLLEELRQVFHITQERHCAEVRRAANDEQLCTIAENVCGPNTWQEWSREGRRPYPLLPRISPQTALSIVANDLAAKALAENAKLASPHETGANLGEALREQANYLMLKHGKHKYQEQPHVIMEEPFKVPDLPNEIKKATLKRKENDAGEASKPNKKRNTQHDYRQQLQQGQQQQQQQIAAQDEDGHVGHPVEQRPSPRTMQQRYFYQQQQKHKQRLSSKKGAAHAALANNSGNLSSVAANTKPAKSGRRRAQKQLQLQQKQQQEQQQQQQQQQHKVLLATTLPAATAAAAEPTTPTTMPQLQQHPNANHLVQPHVEYILDEALKSVAASKLKTLSPVVQQSPTITPRSIVSSPVVFKDNKMSPTPQQQQQQPLPQLSTPVKKYIVEERQASPTICTANLPLAPQIISVQQIAAPPKVRSTTILPPGTKLTPKKIQLLDKQPLPQTPTLPTVVSPSTAQLRVIAYDQQQQQPSQHAISNLSSKATTAAAAATTPQKYIVEERVPSQTATPTSSQSQSQSIATPLSSASAVNIIKNIPASSLNNTLITPLTNAMPVFRKATTSTVGAATVTASPVATAASPSTSQLLGNIKLSSSSIKQVPSSALRNIKICSPNGKVFLPATKLHAGSIIHKLNPNPSNPTAAAAAGGTTVSKATVSVSNAALSPTGHQLTTPTSPQPAAQQRITIQKMQLLTPTQMTSGGVAKGKPTTLSVSKSNLVFLPTSGMRAVTLASSAATSKPKTTSELLSTAKPNVLVIGPASATANAASSSSSTQQQQQQTVVAATTSILGAAGKAKPTANQLITEDTPIDIINMPIIVASDNGASTEASPKTPAAKTAPTSMVVLNATDWEMELDQASKASSAVVTPSTTTAAASTTTTPTSTVSNAASKKLLEALVVEDVREEERSTAVEAGEETATTQLNSRIIELQDDDGSAIEYVDMELEQPIEIESSSSITAPLEAISSKVTTVTVLEESKKPMEVTRMAATTTTLP
ncbi:mucin-2 [Drosophila sulfurigaster albostrigata]|uniref:mucin-2 n=1 Tax=Drosophila sulfurigaster albostrigata TaxID=89887 RepID=UPI002D21EDB1|nr:mucin-2 [Drosophila sulfurigaster albostrigata]